MQMKVPYFVKQNKTKNHKEYLLAMKRSQHQGLRQEKIG